MALLFDESLIPQLVQTANLGLGNHNIKFEDGKSYLIELFYNVIIKFYVLFYYNEKPLMYVSVREGVNILYKISHNNLLFPTYIDELNNTVRFYKSQ